MTPKARDKMSEKSIKYSVMPPIGIHGARTSSVSMCNLDDIADLNDRAPVELINFEDSGCLILRGESTADKIRNGRDGDDNLKSGLRACLNIDLPIDPLTYSQRDDFSIWWIGPNEWRAIGPAAECKDIEIKLRRQLRDEFAVVNVTGGFVHLGLRGPNAETVVRKSCPYNINAENFPIGKVVSTKFAKTQVNLRRTKEGFEILCRRSFIDYLWAWLRDASNEFGLKVSTGK